MDGWIDGGGWLSGRMVEHIDGRMDGRTPF